MDPPARSPAICLRRARVPWQHLLGLGLWALGLASCGPQVGGASPTTASAAPSASSPGLVTSAKSEAKVEATSAPAPSPTAPALPPAPPGAALRRREGKCFIVEHLGGGPEPAPWRESEVQCPPDAPP